MRWGYWYSPFRLAGHAVPDGAAAVTAELEAGDGEAVPTEAPD